MGEATDDTVAEDFIAGRKDLQLEVSLGRRLIETYAAQIVRVRDRIVALHRQAEAGRADEAVIAEARQLVRTADALAEAAQEWMKSKVRPIVEFHGAIMPPEDVNQALVQGWGFGFYRLVRTEYERATACLDGILETRERIREIWAAITRAAIREVETDRSAA